MWLIMDIPLIVTITILFFRWMASQERAQREIEALAHPEDELIWQTPKQTPEHASSHASGAD
jgi:hypothetical protein